ncbi:TonB-dependent siderophore receptor [Pseudomonas oryzihabitans]|uniref:TonB-dependent siderophore receptor n=1 Tax=Pseudomonas oryzihabitans TaxID=47885 RepID=UPI0011A969FD|nr:TonB-dependent receptor [Pseudomonas psychrotolerans]
MRFFHPRLAHLTIALQLGLPLALGLPAAPAQAQSHVQRYDLPAGPLGESLNRLASQAGIALSFDANRVRNLRAPALQGSYSLDEAFARLLKGSGLEAQGGDEGYVLVATEKGPYELGVTEISAQGLPTSVTEGTGSYATALTGSATRLPLSIRETPQSVTVVTRQQLDDQSVDNIAQALGRTPGVVAQAYDSDRLEFSTRGMAITNYQYDGVNTIYDGVYDNGTTQVDMATYDRVDIIKGATGLMTGAGDPSATVNLIRKRPTHDFQGHLSGSAGTWDNYRTEADLSGSLNDTGTLRGRVVGAYQDRQSYLDHYKQKKNVFYGIVEADVSPDTLVTLGYDRQTITPRGTSWTGNPVLYSDGSRIDLPRHFNPGTDWSRREFENQTFFGSVEQNLDGEWKLKVSANQLLSDHDTRLGSASGGNPDPLTGEGAFFYWGRWEGHRIINTLDANVSGPFTLLGREHDLVAGYTYAASRQTGATFDNGASAAVPGNILDWNGNFPMPDFPSNGKYESNQRQNGAYLATRLKPTDDLSIILGTRVSTFKYDQTYSYYNGSSSRTSYEQHGVVTPYAGLVYDLDDTYSLYTSYTRIYDPQTNKDASGKTLDPVEGDSYEAGLKAEYLNGRVNATLAFFRIEQDNLAEYVTTDTQTSEDVYRAIQGATTKGVELEIAGQLTEAWNLSAGYTYARTRDYRGQPVFGYPLASTKPEHLVRLFSTYRLPGQFSPITLGGGLTWQSSFYGNTYDPAVEADRSLKQEGYTLVNLMGRYQFDDHLSFTLNANNVFDKKYLLGVGNFGTSFYGEPRNLMLTTRWDF